MTGKIGRHWKVKDTSKMHHKSWLKGTKGLVKSNDGSFKKGQKAWNYEGKGRLKRKFKKFNGRLVLNSHYVFCSYHNVDRVPKGFIIHHKDGNSLNDSIDNLIMMSDKAHKEFHNRIVGEKLL